MRLYSWRRSVLLSIVCMILKLSFAAAATNHQQNSNHLSQISKWKYLGQAWVAAFNANDEMIAIYDLSFPDSKSKTYLGSLDTSNQNYQRTLELLKQARKTLNHSELEIEEEKTIDLAVFEFEKLVFLSQSRSLTFSNDSEWWKQVPWKSRLLTDLDAPPLRFSLSEIDFDEFIRNDPDLEENRALIEREILQNFEFKSNSLGGFDLYWAPTISDLNDSNSPNLDKSMVIADLVCKRCGFYQNAQIFLLKTLVTKLVSQVPIPFLAGLISTAAEEYFQFQAELRISRQEMLLEWIRSQEENSGGISSTFKFSKPEKSAIIDSIFYSRIELYEFWKWFTPPKKMWKKQEKKALIQAIDSADYLKGQGFILDYLNPRFALTNSNGQAPKIYSLSANRFWNILSPHIAIDYGQPDSIQNDRALVESSHILVHFLSSAIPTPIAGTAISLTFDLLVQDPMHQIQHWEARFNSLLRLKEESGEKWDYERNLIFQQTINPMEISPKVQTELIKSRKEKLQLDSLERID